MKEDMSMEELLSETAPGGQVGSVVTAQVVDITADGVLVDVGLKVEGFIPLSEFRSRPQPPTRGETFPALIKRLAGSEGHPLVSSKEARERLNWDRLAKAKE